MPRALALILVGLFALPSLGQDVPKTARVTFPNQDDLNEFTGSANGCDLPPQLLRPVERSFAAKFPQQYIPYNTAALNRRGVMGLYYVYSGRACKRLRKHFPADIFVMARVRLGQCKLLPNGTTKAWYDVEAKIYSTSRKQEEVIFRRANVPRDEVANLLVGKEQTIIQRIIAASTTP